MNQTCTSASLGYVPKGYDISITEMEYNRAIERGIPRLISLMHEDHPLKAADVEKGEGATKLESLKAKMKIERVVNFFKSPADLQAQVIDSLSKLRQPDPTAFHYVSDIPTPPESYIAHPYTLLQTKLVGRQAELNLLTDWVAKPSSGLYQARILSIVAIGGMGKSALTWKWFNDIAPQEMHPLVGRLWWSFYESDATFDNFVIRALAYVSKQSKEDIQKILPPERESQLLSILDREPFLLVLDGLERILIASTRQTYKQIREMSASEVEQSSCMVSHMTTLSTCGVPLASAVRVRRCCRSSTHLKAIRCSSRRWQVKSHMTAAPLEILLAGVRIIPTSTLSVCQ
jgi:hypothetical protein